MGQRCVYLDRDRTIIEDPGYLTDPEAVKLLPGVELALKSLAQAGFKLVVVTNQSAIARGLLTEEGLERVHEEMGRQLHDRGVELDGVYYCPFHPEGTEEAYARESPDRKPQPGMLLRAAAELDIDLTRSWMVGDSPRDVEAGQRAGCRTIRVRVKTDTGPEKDEDAQADFTVRNLVDAARLIVRESADEAPEGGAEAAPSAGIAAEAPAPVEQMTDSQVLREILRHVRQMARADGRGEFSVSRLIASIFQILALLALVWGLFYLPNAANSAEHYNAWLLAMGMTGAFQLIALTFFVISHQR